MSGDYTAQDPLQRCIKSMYLFESATQGHTHTQAPIALIMTCYRHRWLFAGTDKPHLSPVQLGPGTCGVMLEHPSRGASNLKGIHQGSHTCRPHRFLTPFQGIMQWLPRWVLINFLIAIMRTKVPLAGALCVACQAMAACPQLYIAR